MFYVCDEKDGKFGVMDTSDGVVEYFTSEELHNINRNLTRVFGVLKGDRCAVVSVDEYQSKILSDYIVFSFVNTRNNRIYLGLEDNASHKVILSRNTEVYLKDNSMKSCSSHKNGDLNILIDEGRDRRCIGLYVWLDYKDLGDTWCDSWDECENIDELESHPIILQLFIEIEKDGEIDVVGYEDWDFDEGGEYYYNSNEDRIRYRC